MNDVVRNEYSLDTSSELWWCNSHCRIASHILKNATGVRHVCDPLLAGTLLPCVCVNLTGLVEIIEDTSHEHPQG